MEPLEEELQELRELKIQAIRQAPARQGATYWVLPALAYSLVGVLCLAGYSRLSAGDWFFGDPEEVRIGYLTDVQGTLRHAHETQSGGLVGKLTDRMEAWRRIESGKDLRLPLRIGDGLQTGESSRAELRLEGGSVLRLEPGTSLQIEPDPENYSQALVLRVTAGRGVLELAAGHIDGRRIRIRGAEGRTKELPRSRRIELLPST